MIILYQIAFVPARNPYQIAMVDPDYQIKGGRGGHSDPEIKVKPRSPKIFIWPLGPQFGLKIRGAWLLPGSTAREGFCSHTRMVLLA